MKTSLKELLEPARLALATYWPAMLAIQCLALAVVLSYYCFDAASTGFATIARWKAQGGLGLVVLATILSGGVLPELLKRWLRPNAVSAPSAQELIHQFGMWAGVGILVDRFYWLQGLAFGHGTDLATLLPKILVDQFIFTPLICLPFIVSWFLLYQADYRLIHWARRLSLPLLAQRILPLWLTCLCFWPIMLAIIYSLPADLQFPLFLFGNAAYSILMIFIARRQLEQSTEQ